MSFAVCSQQAHLSHPSSVSQDTQSKDLQQSLWCQLWKHSFFRLSLQMLFVNRISEYFSAARWLPLRQGTCQFWGYWVIVLPLGFVIESCFCMHHHWNLRCGCVSPAKWRARSGTKQLWFFKRKTHEHWAGGARGWPGVWEMLRAFRGALVTQVQLSWPHNSSSLALLCSISLAGSLRLLS